MPDRIYVYEADKCPGCKRVFDLCDELDLLAYHRPISAFVDPGDAWHDMEGFVCHASRFFQQSEERRMAPFVAVHKGDRISFFDWTQAEESLRALATTEEREREE